MDILSDLKYTSTHEWARLEDDGSVTVGITDHAQQLLGELVFVELPAVGKAASVGGEVAVVESVKAASDVYAPVSGKVIAINEALVDTPELVNEDPYGGGWLFRLKLTHKEELNNLLDANTYIGHVETTGG